MLGWPALSLPGVGLLTWKWLFLGPERPDQAEASSGGSGLLRRKSGAGRWGGHAWENYHEEFSLASLVATRAQASPCFPSSVLDSFAGAGSASPPSGVCLPD